jgi:tetratricopeptide (TPR) repeat protein
LSAQELGLVPSSILQNAHVQYNHTSIVQEKDELRLKRRELLRVLSVAGSVLLLPDVDWERVDTAIGSPSHIDMAVLKDLKRINASLWNLFMAAPSKASVLDGVLGQFKMYATFLKEPQTRQTRRHLNALASDLSQLAGEIFFDSKDHDAAQHCYVFAASTAKEAKAYDLWASALARHSYLPLFDDHYDTVLPLIQQAQRIALHGNSELPTRYWVASIEAEAHSGVGKLEACQEALERANGVTDLDGNSPNWVRFDGSRLPALREACFVRLNQPDLAMLALNEALSINTKQSRRRAMVLADLSLASLQQHSVEKACFYADEVVGFVERGGSSFLKGSLSKIHQQLKPYADAMPVKLLQQHIAVLA